MSELMQCCGRWREEEKVAPLVRQFEFATAAWVFLSTVLREIPQIVSALLTQFEDALSRTLAPALVAQYETPLPDTKLLQAKLHEFYMANCGNGDEA